MALSFRSCRACRQHTLEAFISFTGATLRTSQQHTRRTITQPIKQVSPVGSRTFSITRNRSLQLPQRDQDSNHDSHGDSKASSSSNPESSSSIPWYLQVETPEPPPHINTSPLLASQEIPQIPSDAPPILDPILHQLSVSIGLDNLTLLDLRSCTNPPPALGSNLFMVIGTARSHKHLNTSADRFCRWLRSTYKMRPYADGLLGRNEMKLKLRRKNRRMKLAQSVGNTLAMTEVGAGGKYDDGITTGWICCNLGPVDEAVIPEDGEGAVHVHEPAPSAKEQERISKEEDEYINPVEDHFYAGFGSRSDAPKIVVQMFTEEKRLEMDLEGLWDSRLHRRAEKREAAELAAEKHHAEIESTLDESDTDNTDGARDSRIAAAS